MCCVANVRVRGQTVGVGSLLARRSSELHSGRQAWWHVPLFAGPTFLSFKPRRLSSKWRCSDTEDTVVGSGLFLFFSPDPTIFPIISGDCKPTTRCQEFEIFPHLSLPAKLSGSETSNWLSWPLNGHPLQFPSP